MFRKGQYFSFDAIIASVIFMMAVVMLLSYWHSVRTFLEFQSGDLTREAMRISATFFSPAPSGVLISSADRRVNQSLFGYLPNDEQQLRTKFATPYKIYIEENKVKTGKVSKGEKPPENSTEVVKIRRVGAVAEDSSTTLATFDIYLYR